ncbi:MAG TPA: DUF4349 domain-containing protein [Bacteroidia bacterium]
MNKQSSNIKKKVKVFLMFSVALFLTLFIGRLIYGNFENKSGQTNLSYEDFFSNQDFRSKNYASEKMSMKSELGEQPQAFNNSQKYEMTSVIRNSSKQFDEDLSKIRSVTKTFSAVVQFEQSKGNSPARETHLMIGVNPDKFDSFTSKIKSIGSKIAFEITKTDKTNEYRQLNAQKISIEKSLSNLNELKSKSGNINEYISLIEKTMEIEEKLQSLGVELGNFDTENEFCTVKVSLYENGKSLPMKLARKLLISTFWALEYFIKVLLTLFLIMAAAYVFAYLVEKGINIYNSAKSK